MIDRWTPDGRPAKPGRPRHRLRRQVESLLRAGAAPAQLAREFALPRQTVGRWHREMLKPVARAVPDGSVARAGRPATRGA
jgi:hypothetical protein